MLGLFTLSMYAQCMLRCRNHPGSLLQQLSDQYFDATSKEQ
jgi:hypothetical protein